MLQYHSCMKGNKRLFLIHHQVSFTGINLKTFNIDISTPILVGFESHFLEKCIFVILWSMMCCKQCVYLSIWLPICECISVCLSVCLPIFLSTYLFFPLPMLLPDSLLFVFLYIFSQNLCLNASCLFLSLIICLFLW